MILPNRCTDKRDKESSGRYDPGNPGSDSRAQLGMASRMRTV